MPTTPDQKISPVLATQIELATEILESLVNISQQRPAHSYLQLSFITHRLYDSLLVTACQLTDQPLDRQNTSVSHTNLNSMRANRG